MEQNVNLLETTWKEYSKVLLSFIRRKINSYEDAEDILADIFVKLAKQAELSRVPDKLPNWLYRVARNAIIDFYRTHRPLEKLPEDIVQGRLEPQVLTELSACIIPMIQELPDVYRLPILLSEIEGKKQSQVAKELGISLAAVKSRISRGRKKLKALMAKRCILSRDESGRVLDYKQKS